MKTFLYDGSFDGLLTALYHALADGNPENTLQQKTQHQPDLFSQSVSIATDSDLTQRMYKGITRRISRQTLRNLYHLYLSEIPEAGTLSYHYLQKGFGVGSNLNQRLTDPVVHPVLKKCHQVLREYHRMTGLLRFQSLQNGTLYAAYGPDAQLTPLLAGHFSRRLSGQPWIIHDHKREMAAFWDAKEWILHPLPAEGELQLSDTEAYFQELWRRYFNQIAIQERKNLKLQQQFVPKKYRQYLTELSE